MDGVLIFSVKEREDFTIGNRTANSSIWIWVPLHCHSKLRWLFSRFTLLNWMSQSLIQSNSHDENSLVKLEVPTRGPHTLSSDNFLGPEQTLRKDHRCFVPSAATKSIHKSSEIKSAFAVISCWGTFASYDDLLLDKFTRQSRSQLKPSGTEHKIEGEDCVLT